MTGNGLSSPLGRAGSWWNRAALTRRFPAGSPLLDPLCGRGGGKTPAGAACVVFSSFLLTRPTWARPLALDQKCPGPKCCQERVCGQGKAPRPHPMRTFSPASWLLAGAPAHRSLPCGEEAVYPCRPPRDERTVLAVVLVCLDGAAGSQLRRPFHLCVASGHGPSPAGGSSEPALWCPAA